MKTPFHLVLGIAVTAWALSGCKPEAAQPDLRQAWSFESGAAGWTAGFSDYPEGEDSMYQLSAAVEALPAALGADSSGFRITGSNHSDDLFMYLARKVTGLEPRTRYSVVFRIRLASQYPQESVGIGGSPGGSVFLKAGAVAVAPAPIPDPEVAGHLRMNLDKGNQGTDGADMQLLGDIGTSGELSEWMLISRSNAEEAFEAETDSSGSLWLIVGTDSGFEGLTTLYYDAIEVEFTAQP